MLHSSQDKSAQKSSEYIYMDNHTDEPSPILGSWRNVYILVAATLVAVIVLLYFFTLYFQ